MQKKTDFFLSESFGSKLVILILLFVAFISNQTLSQYTKMPGNAFDIGIGGGVRWVVGINPVGGGNYGIYKWNGSNWENVPGSGVRIAVGPRGNPWVVSADGLIYVRNNNQWNKTIDLPGGALDIAVSKAGTFAIGKDYNLYYLNRDFGRWDRYNPSVRANFIRVAAHPNGSVWVLATNDSQDNPGTIYVFAPNDFDCRSVGGSNANDIGIGANGSVWIIGKEAHQWRGKNVWKLVGGVSDNVAVDGYGHPWLTNSTTGDIYKHTGPVFGAPTDAGYIAYYNEAGYVSKYTVSYQVDGDPYVILNSGNLTLGQGGQFNLPMNSTNITIKGEGKTGLIWEPWRTTFQFTYNRAPRICFKSYGTTLNQKSNNNCTGTITKDDGDKFWELISALP
jgi:Tectonin domain